jgi:hypothetical protein
MAYFGRGIKLDAVRLPLRPKVRKTDWGPNDTRLLTGRGMLNGESESFPATLWGPVATVMVTFGPQELSFEPEKKAGRPEIAKPL